MSLTEPNPALGERAAVELRVPADSAFVSVLRTISAGLAARLDFTVEDIEDLRMAIGEAAALVLGVAEENTDLEVRFWWQAKDLVAALRASTKNASGGVDRDSFAWQVLNALASHAEVSEGEGEVEIVVQVSGTPLGTTAD